MAMLTKDALLGASDLIEREIDLPSIGGTVRVRSLPAAVSNQAQSEAIEQRIGARGEQTAHIHTGKLEALHVLHGLVEPKLDSLQEVEQLAQRIGPAWKRIVDTIAEISAIDMEAIEKANTMFQPGGPETERTAVGDGVGAGGSRPDLRLSAGT